MRYLSSDTVYPSIGETSTNFLKPASSTHFSNTTLPLWMYSSYRSEHHINTNPHYNTTSPHSPRQSVSVYSPKQHHHPYSASVANFGFHSCSSWSLHMVQYNTITQTPHPQPVSVLSNPRIHIQL